MRQRLRQLKRFRSALALVAVLWISALMTSLVSIAAQGSLLDSRISQIQNEKQRCRWACRGGIETAIALLQEDDRAYDGLTDLWATNPDELENLDFGGVRLTIKVIDAASKLNVNTASAAQLLCLPDMTEDIAESILDWIDSDDEVRTGGAESGYYLNLDVGYWSRNAAVRSPRELLRVKGVTDGFFYGDSENELISPENEGWINYLTCWSQEINQDSEGNTRVNVNRTSAGILSTQVGLSEAQARWVSENRPFRSLSALLGNTTTATQPQQSQPSTQQNQQSSRTTQTSRQTQTSPQTQQAGQQQQQPSAPLDWQTLLTAADKISLVNRQFIPGRININTAGVHVLTALFEGNRELAESVIAARQGQGGVFLSLSELSQAEGMTEDVLKNYLDLLTVRSSVFEIHATAVSEATGLQYSVEAVVNRDLSQGQITYWREGVSR
jgi:type II secretory pathway component PulK